MLCNDKRDHYFCQVSSPALLWMVAWKELCPDLLVKNHLMELTPRFLYRSPPPTTCCSPPATHLTVGGSSGIVAGSSKTGDVTPSTVVGSLGIVDGSSKIRDMVLAWRGTSIYFITLRWSRRCACSMEEGVAGAERLFARVLLMARSQDLSTWPSNIARSRCCWVAIPI